MGAGGARITFHAELFPALLSCKVAFFGLIYRLVGKNFLGASPQTLNFPWYNYETNILNIVEYEGQNLPLWRNIPIHKCAIRGSLAPPALGRCRRTCLVHYDSEFTSGRERKDFLRLRSKKKGVFPCCYVRSDSRPKQDFHSL